MNSGGYSDRRLIDDRRVADLLSEKSDLALFSLDPDGVCTRWEPASANMRRVTADEIVGRCFEDFFPAKEQRLRTFWEQLEIAAERGRSNGQGWRTDKDGTRRWTRYTLFANREHDGSISGYLGVVMDATNEKHSSNALQANEEQFRLLVEGLKDHAIYRLDREGRVTSWNAGARRLTGYRSAEIIGRHLHDFYTPDDREAGLPDKVLEAARLQGRHETEGWRLRKDGTRFYARVLIQPVYDSERQPTGFTKMTRDVTSEAKAAAELAKAREALDQSEKLRSLGELTGGIAHDFNNLLTVTRGAAELLQHEDLPEEKRAHHVQAIVETADRAAELTGQLLSFARRQPLQPKSADLNAVIADMADLLRRTLGGQISILKAPQPGLWKVRVDPTQLRNLILNAAINARDAMEGAGTLTIATRNLTGIDGEEVRLSISDTGRGMTPDEKARAFEPFFTTKAVGKGTGLGLSQAYGFAAQSGGRLELASDLGRGTTLNLFLPRLEDGSGTGEGEMPAEGQLPHGTRILLVEDSRTVARFAQALLEEMGCTITHASTAEDALALLAEQDQQFDVVFSDIIMPGISGLDLAAQVRAQKPTLPIVLATGYSEAAARGEGSEFPILPKPYRREALASMLGQAMFTQNRVA